MVGFQGFILLAVVGGGLALFLGVPPTWIGIYVVGLLVVGAISGFGSSNSEDSGNGNSGSRKSSYSSSGNSSSRASNSLEKAGDAASGIINELGNSFSSSSERRHNNGEISLADNPEDRRRVGSFGNTASNPSNNSSGTTEQEYLNEDEPRNTMANTPDIPGFGDIKDTLTRAEKYEEDELTKMGKLAQAIEEEEQREEKLEHLQDEELNLIKNISKEIKDLESKEEDLARIIDRIERGGNITQSKWDEATSLADAIEQEAERIGKEINKLHKFITQEDKLVSDEAEEEEVIDELEEAVEEEYQQYQDLIAMVTRIKGANMNIDLGPGKQQ